jgi:SPP1 gp7 family putative phage head morphogenesis protein
MVHGAMLGALDSVTERESEEDEPSAKLQQCRLFFKAPASKVPFGEVIKKFEERDIVSKDVFEQLSAAAKQKAFTVAGLATEELLGDAHAELGRMLKDSDASSYYDTTTNKWVYKGPNLREFDKFAKERLESAGWTPANPSHVETIFRTNVASAYSGGRVAEMTQPDVLSARPYWQIRAVGDSRSRPAHKKANNTILAADHPFWRTCFTPFGFNCRCRVTSRSKRWVDAHGGPTMVPVGLPDPGFTCGTNELISAGVQHQQEGTVAPQPPMNPAHQIERAPPPPRGIPMPPEQPLSLYPELPKNPPLPYAGPVAPPPFELPTFDQHKHARSLIVEGLSDKRVASVMSAFSYHDLKILEVIPTDFRLTTKLIAKDCPGLYTVDIPPMGRVNQIEITTSLPKETWGQKFVPGSTFSYSTGQASEIAAVKSNLHHEFGHMLHLRGGAQADGFVAVGWQKRNPITKYARTTPEEYFAECYSTYRGDHGVLKAFDPAGFEMVEKVLSLWGLPHA